VKDSPGTLCDDALFAVGAPGTPDFVVNVSSLAGIVVFPGLVTYSASKAALSHFTAGLRADFRGLPIGTTLVELGAVPTDLLAKADNYEPTAKAFQRAYRVGTAVDTPVRGWPRKSSRPCRRVGDTCGSPSDLSISPCWSKCPTGSSTTPKSSP
jgi:NAD(P)-dependent dehydrogenase (short-subunit alcohol dehydrogenase family)